MTIKWRLSALMAERGCSNKELATATDFHEVTISKLRKEMPDRLEKVTLDKLCHALNCQPGDLMQWVGSEETKSAKPSPEKTPRQRGSIYQSKNTRALRAKATETRSQVWEDLRKPLQIKADDTSIT